MANFTCLASARHAVLKSAGWDVGKEGLFKAPSIKVIVGEEVHVSILKALSMLGLGRDRITHLPVDNQGRIIAEEIPIESTRMRPFLARFPLDSLLMRTYARRMAVV
ncbi:MAG: hypothetical protein GF421_13865 [Candidatus Aminicenantes bacterium]|nr:hypothetical protein [Candidatus Aminicenantes bacterium]